MNARTKEKALSALEGMRSIVSADMLIKGSYVSDDVADPSRAHQVCRGRKFCAIGSLWTGYGVTMPYGSPYLPGADDGRERRDYLKTRPALRAAYDALNDAAEAYVQKHGLRDGLDGDFEATVEALFESETAGIGRPELLKIIASAKRRLKAA